MNLSKIAKAFTLLNERKWQKVAASPFIRRVDAKRGKSVTRKMRKAASQSMLDMGQTKRHQPLPRFLDERTKMLFSAYDKRK